MGGGEKFRTLWRACLFEAEHGERPWLYLKCTWKERKNIMRQAVDMWYGEGGICDSPTDDATLSLYCTAWLILMETLKRAEITDIKEVGNGKI